MTIGKMSDRELRIAERRAAIRYETIKLGNKYRNRDTLERADRLAIRLCELRDEIHRRQLAR